MTRKEAEQYLQTIPEDEPVFVLRAQDKVAAHVVLMWAACAEIAGSPPEKVKEAQNQSLVMAVWQSNNVCKVPD